MLLLAFRSTCAHSSNNVVVVVPFVLPFIHSSLLAMGGRAVLCCALKRHFVLGSIVVFVKNLFSWILNLSKIIKIKFKKSQHPGNVNK